MKLHLYDVLESPCITEKGAKQGALGKYFFRVHRHATKDQIRRSVEEIFNVKVVKINTMTIGGKWKRLRSLPGKTSDWKKAIVTLKEGQKIELA